MTFFSPILSMLVVLCLPGLIAATFPDVRGQLNLNGSLFAAAADEFIDRRSWVPAADCNPACAANNSCCKVRRKVPKHFCNHKT